MAVEVNIEKCDGCGTCMDECPAEAIKIINQKAEISEECTECGICTDICPNEALSLK